MMTTSELYSIGGALLIVFGLWVVSVELRLKAAKLLGEIVFDDLKERGRITEDTWRAVCGKQR